MADWEESRYSTTFCHIGVHWEEFMGQTTGMGHVPTAPTDGTLIPRINQIKNQRRVCRNRGMQARRRLPGPETDPRDELTLNPSCS